MHKTSKVLNASNQTVMDRQYFEIDEIAELLTCLRTKCVAQVSPSKYVEFDLYNADDMHRRYSGTFEVPKLVDLQLVGPGAHIKVTAQWHDPNLIGERFWIDVSNVVLQADGRKNFYGTCGNNTAVVPHGAYLGPIPVASICEVDLKHVTDSSNTAKSSPFSASQFVGSTRHEDIYSTKTLNGDFYE